MYFFFSSIFVSMLIFLGVVFFNSLVMFFYCVEPSFFIFLCISRRLAVLRFLHADMTLSLCLPAALCFGWFLPFWGSFGRVGGCWLCIKMFQCCRQLGVWFIYLIALVFCFISWESLLKRKKGLIICNAGTGKLPTC